MNIPTNKATTKRLIPVSSHATIAVRAIIIGAVLALINFFVHFIQANPAVFGGYTSIIYFVGTELEQTLPTLN